LLYRLVPNAVKALTIVKPDTVIGWHRAGFRSDCAGKQCRRFPVTLSWLLGKRRAELDGIGSG